MSYSLVQPQVANRGQTGGQYFQIGRVKSVVLGPFKGNSREVDPDYGSPSDIGKIRYELIYSALATSKSDQVSEPAFPLFSFLKQYPIVNEIVFIIAGPTERQNDRISNQQFFYLPPYDVWNSANHGAFPNMSEYAQYLNQFANQPGYSGNATSGSLPLGYTFQEKKDVKNLRPFEGDVIMQARFGQSIRFGSTVPVMKDFNTWSNSGTNGSPITIISNSQGRRPGLTKFDPLVEDINQDGSAIWMTSDQQINLVDINSFPLSSFGVGINQISQNVITSQINNPTSSLSAQAQDQNNIS
jgi:hypothetical protein